MEEDSHLGLKMLTVVELVVSPLDRMMPTVAELAVSSPPDHRMPTVAELAVSSPPDHRMPTGEAMVDGHLDLTTLMDPGDR